MEFVAGIDIGAKTVKVIIMDEKREVPGKSVLKTQPDFTSVAKEALDLALQRAGLKEKDLSYIATTGFGRYNVPFRDVQITEITCVARGAAFLFPKTHCVLDIGAQSTHPRRRKGTGIPHQRQVRRGSRRLHRAGCQISGGEGRKCGRPLYQIR